MASIDDRLGTLCSVARLLGTFARQIELKRALEAADREPHINFWRIICGGLSNLAVIEWCKLFGAESGNALHWKPVYPGRHDEFRSGLFNATSTDAVRFAAYWREMKQWRDTDFAHFDPGSQRPSRWPHFEIAAQAADYYYSWVSAELVEMNHHKFPTKLAIYREVIRAEFDGAALIALNSTKDLPASKA